MNSLEIRNQKLAELRAQKAKGIRRPITVIEQLPKREVEEEEKNKKKEKEIEIEIEKDLALGSEVEEKVGDVAKELKKDLELLQAFEPLPSGLVQPSEQPKILKLKSEFAAKKQASDKNQQEIAYLQGLIHSKKSNIASILTSLKSYEQEKHEIQLEVTQLLSQQSQIRSSYSCKRESLESSITSLISQMSHHKRPDSASSYDSQISDLKQDLENARCVYLEKESQCIYLREILEEVATENSLIQESLQNSIPEPPLEDSYVPIVEVMPSYAKNLISDVGSTGNLLKNSEENKHYPSPDPHENLLHQSTGETMQLLIESDQGAATPPNELQWGEQLDLQNYDNLEENKDPGTPKRDGSLRVNSSGSSTPHRYTDSVHRVHNLLVPGGHGFNSEEDSDFFTNLNREAREKRKAEPINKSLFD